MQCGFHHLVDSFAFDWVSYLLWLVIILWDSHVSWLAWFAWFSNYCILVMIQLDFSSILTRNLLEGFLWVMTCIFFLGFYRLLTRTIVFGFQLYDDSYYGVGFQYLYDSLSSFVFNMMGDSYLIDGFQALNDSFLFFWFSNAPWLYLHIILFLKNDHTCTFL